VSRPSVRTLVVPRAGELEIRETAEPDLADGRFRAQTLFSGLSAGTELTWYRGTSPYFTAGWDAELGIFDRGRPSRQFPVDKLGYMEVARVTDTRTPAVDEGGLVAMTYGHTTVHHGDPVTEHVVALPPDLDPVLGIYVAHLGPICLNGLLHAAADVGGAEIGDGVRGRLVVVTGGGLIGLLVGLAARVHGAAEVVVVDPTPDRRAAAETLGLRAVDDTDDVARELKLRWRHGPADHGADVAFQCRGQDRALATALRTLRPQGTVVDLAFYTGGTEAVGLGEEFHHNGLSVRCAQIGRVPRGLGHRWDRRRLSAETLALLTDHGRAVKDALLTDVVPFDDAPALFADLSARRRHVLSAAFAVETADG
jgi:threonine dehydrogenase-like Zn-dependent dehydrogenase